MLKIGSSRTRLLLIQLLLHDALASIRLNPLHIGHVHQTGHDLALFERLSIHNVRNFDLVFALALYSHACLVLERNEVTSDSVQ